jgi:hypothetical protein
MKSFWHVGFSATQGWTLYKVVRGTPLRFDVASYVRGSPSKEASTRALLARSLIRHYLVPWRWGWGIGTTEWQLRAELENVAAYGNF